MNVVEPGAQAILGPLLTEGETLLWAASVDRKAQARAATPRFIYALGLLALGVIVLGLTASVLLTAYDLGDAIPALFPVLLGIVGILGAVHQFGIVLRGRNSAYGLTARRCLVATAGPKQAHVSLPLSRVVGLHAGGDANVGTIMLTAAPEGARASSVGFSLISIRRPREVETLLLDLIAPRKGTP